jgi:3-hydroxy-9,10-secoandrosta-1,3,5(10)-triene-9,17-dione monooxygenase
MATTLDSTGRASGAHDHVRTADDEIFVQRALDLIPDLLRRQAETEARTFYAEDTHEAFKQAGFYRMLVPRQFGGHETEIETFFRVVVALSSGCPSTGWQFCFGALHAVTVGSLFDQSAQALIFGDGHFICAATVKPQGTVRQYTDAQLQIDGTYNYCSGIPYSTHFMSHAFWTEADGTKGAPASFVAPSNSWKRLNDWGDSLGLKGSGSHSVRFENGFVPEQFVLKGVDLLNHPPRGDSPCAMHYGRTMALWFLEPASVALGSIKGALKEYDGMMRSKMTMRPPPVLRMQDPDFRQSYGTAIAKVAFAEAALHDICRQWSRAAFRQMRGEQEFSIEQELRICLIAAQIIDTCWHVMESIIFPTAGSSAARDSERMQRLFRDMAMARSHAYNTQIPGMTRHLADEVLGVNAGSASRDVFLVKR